MRDAHPVALLRAAAHTLDAQPTAIAEAKLCRGFADGARWMAARLVESGRQITPVDTATITRLGRIKYTLAVAAMAVWIVIGGSIGLWWLALASPLAFYAVEAQMVFLFPAALTGSGRPFRDARAMTLRAGGTVRVVATVLPIAAFMLFGGLGGRGAIRAWAVGCLAVVHWFDRLPDGNAEWFDPVDVFGFARLRLRHETVRADAEARVLLVSDLHLGRRWNRRLPRDILRLALRSRPTVILLAGDLIDRPSGTPAFAQLLDKLAKVAAVGCIPGNHDGDAETLRHLVLNSGGHWLTDRPLMTSNGAVAVYGDAATNIPAGVVGVLCVHRPATFDRLDVSPFRLLVAGHLHGGQCVLGRWRGRLLPAWLIHRWHVDRRDGNGRTYVVSRGAGDTLPVRFNCPREVVLIHLCPQGGGLRPALPRSVAV